MRLDRRIFAIAMMICVVYALIEGFVRGTSSFQFHFWFAVGFIFLVFFLAIED
jgi:hypothetical protein